MTSFVEHYYRLHNPMQFTPRFTSTLASHQIQSPIDSTMSPSTTSPSGSPFTTSTSPPSGKVSSVSASSSPRVQLVPHARTLSFDASLTESERRAVDSTSFDARDLSSKDFDFDDIFTYDRPQQKISRMVEVSSHIRERNTPIFSYSHYPATNTSRQKANGHRVSASEMYLRNGRDARSK